MFGASFVPIFWVFQLFTVQCRTFITNAISYSDVLLCVHGLLRFGVPITSSILHGIAVFAWGDPFLVTKSETWRGPVDVGDTMEFRGESYLETFPTAGTIKA